MDARNEILDAIQILIGRALESTTKIYNATCKGLVSGNVALMRVNGVDTPVVFYGDTPNVNKQYRVFVPEGNMSNAFMITGGGTGGSKPTVVDYNMLVGKPSINGTTVQGNQTSKDMKLYGDGNQPPYPVTSVNGQTGDVTIEAGGVTSVNGKTGEVNLVASDVGAVSTDNITQTLGSSTTKVPSEKAVVDALSGAGAGDMLKATYDPTGSVAQAGGIPDYVAGQLPTVNDATLTIQKNGTAVGTFTANASANKSINITMAKGDVGLSNVDNVKQYSADNPPPYPVTSVNGQTGAVNIDVGGGGGGGVDIVLSRTQPSGLKAGDYWYQIVT